MVILELDKDMTIVLIIMRYMIFGYIILKRQSITNIPTKNLKDNTILIFEFIQGYYDTPKSASEYCSHLLDIVPFTVI